MEEKIAALQQERKENLRNVLDGIVPKRVPISLSITAFAIAEMAGVDPRLIYWDPAVIEEKAVELAKRIPTDVNIAGRVVLQPSKYQGIGSEAVIMGSNGFMQHPNTHMMEPSEYDEFIQDPYAFIVEKAVPRVCKEFSNPSRVAMAMTASDYAAGQIGAKINAMNRRLTEQFGWYAEAPVGGGGYSPMDILSDQLRSFSGMLTDIRRCPDKVKAAIEAVEPLVYTDSRPGNPAIYTRYSYGFYPLHMATFMRIKDFEKLWWPAHKKLWDGYAAEGFRCGGFLEDNWNKQLDYLQDLPTGTFFTFENTDAKLLKEKLSPKMTLSSGFPIEYLTQCTAEQAADKTKEWLDIMAWDGNYIFGLSKSILVAADVKLENLEAVAKTVLEYGVHSNPGTKFGLDFNAADYKPYDNKTFESRAFRSWDKYLADNPNTPVEAKPIIEQGEKNLLKYYLALLK